MPGNSQRATDVRPAFLYFAMGLLGLLMVAGCLTAKSFVLGGAIAKGMGKPVHPFPGILATGLAFGAPVQTAILLAFLPATWIRRVAVAGAWMIVVMLAFAAGLYAHPYQDSPALFSNRVLSILPIFAFGWFAPLGLLRLLGGWRFSMGEPDEDQVENRKISLADLFALTLVASICLFSLEFGDPRSFALGLMGMTAGFLLGAVFSVAIYFIFQFPVPISLAFYLLPGAGTYFVTRQLIVMGGGPASDATSALLASTVLAILSSVFVLKCLGVQLRSRQAGKPG